MKFKIGDKVVPLSKSIGMTKLPNCLQWQTAISTGQNYLFVTNIDGDIVTCSHAKNVNVNGGNWYLQSDLIPYVEPVNTQKEEEVNMEKTILEEAQSLIYGDREKDYGKTSDNFADIAKGWEVITKTSITPEQVALMMAWLKICRANKDNCGKRDSYVDLAGYAGCIEKIKKGL
ncbi:MAG: phage Yecey3 [Bacteroidota bacterium]|jgi:hypothetical protein